MVSFCILNWWLFYTISFCFCPRLHPQNALCLLFSHWSIYSTQRLDIDIESLHSRTESVCKPVGQFLRFTLLRHLYARAPFETSLTTLQDVWGIHPNLDVGIDKTSTNDHVSIYELNIKSKLPYASNMRIVHFFLLKS